MLSMEQGRLSGTEALGQCIVTMNGVNEETPVRFNEPIMLSGEVVGYMAGSILLKNKAPDFVTL